MAVPAAAANAAAATRFVLLLASLPKLLGDFSDRIFLKTSSGGAAAKAVSCDSTESVASVAMAAAAVAAERRYPESRCPYGGESMQLSRRFASQLLLLLHSRIAASLAAGGVAEIGPDSETVVSSTLLELKNALKTALL
jgi:hypothetical protein